jgi:hypothetical protein
MDFIQIYKLFNLSIIRCIAAKAFQIFLT